MHRNLGQTPDTLLDFPRYLCEKIELHRDGGGKAQE
jgi:hypothetical protein